MSWLQRKLWAAVLLLALVPAMTVTVHAADQDGAEPYIRQMLNYYLHYQERAAEEIDLLLAQIETIDPKQAESWERIMDYWSWVNNEMDVNTGSIPEGLPQDDSLCIVVLGYGLNSDGSMRSELVGRLKVALRFAEKYPNAYIACTGGPTSDVEGVTEALRMTQWLTDNGIEQSRIIQETKSLSTVRNARNTYRLLNSSYPQVRHIAIVTSDYHVRRGCVLFNAVSTDSSINSGGRVIDVVGNAAFPTDSREESLYTQASGLASLAGIDFDDLEKPPLS